MAERQPKQPQRPGACHTNAAAPVKVADRVDRSLLYEVKKGRPPR